MHEYQHNDKHSKMHYSVNDDKAVVESSPFYHRQCEKYQKRINNEICSLLHRLAMLHKGEHMKQCKSEFADETNVIIDANEIEVDHIHGIIATNSY